MTFLTPQLACARLFFGFKILSNWILICQDEISKGGVEKSNSNVSHHIRGQKKLKTSKVSVVFPEYASFETDIRLKLI